MQKDEHELIFWKQAAKNMNEWGKNFRHRNFYSFFELEKIEGEILEIGCGGMPIDTYYDIEKKYNITIVDPIIDDLLKLEEYQFLKKYSFLSKPASHTNTDKKYDNIVILNCLDHIEDPEEQIITIQKNINLLKKHGKLYLYYDLRREPCEGHYPIEHEKITAILKESCVLLKQNNEINKKHVGWGNVYESHRSIYIKS